MVKSILNRKNTIFHREIKLKEETSTVLHLEHRVV
jgi:hypothetical protein